MKLSSRLLLVIGLVSLTLQYVGCGGAELASAKLYRNQRNYIKADELLQKALKSEPTGDEIWAVYLQNLFDLKQYEKIAEVVDTARLYAVENRALVEQVRRNTWVELFNGGWSAYDQNPESPEQQKAAIALLETAKRVAPEQPETYELLGDVYYSAQDTPKYLSTYESALANVRTTHDQGVALGLMLKMDPSNAESAIGGSPARKEYLPLSSGDSIMVYVYPSKEAYLYFEKTKKAPRKYELTGWKFTANDAVGMNPTRVSLKPYQVVAIHYLGLGDESVARGDKATAERHYDKVVPLMVSVQRLDPSDPSAASIIPTIYNKLGQTDRAKAEYERMISENPSKHLYASYAVVLMNSDDHQGAIAALEKALEIDPGFHNALFNLGATYQNMAASTQKKDPKKDVRPHLEKAVEYFEKAYTINRNDYLSIAYLVEDYDVLGNAEKKTKFTSELDNLSTTEAAKDPAYWNAVGRVFARVKGGVEKSAAAFKKAEELSK